MDDRRARELLEMATAADEASGQVDDAARRALRTAADDLDDAATALLATDPTAALELVAALTWFWQDAGRVDQGRELSERIAGQVPAVERTPMDGPRAAALGRARLALAELAFRQGDQGATKGHAEAAISVAMAHDDRACASLGWTTLARVAFRDGDGDAMEAAADRALALAGSDALARRGALHMRAWSAHTRGDVPEARRRFEDSLAYRRSIGAGRASEVVEIANIAELDLDAGDPTRAAQAFAEVLETARDLDNRYLLLNTIPSAAAVAAAVGRDPVAAQLFGSIDGLAEAFGLTLDPGGDREEYRLAIAERLGEAAFAAELARGRALSPEQASEMAIATCRSIGGGGIPR